VKSVIEFKDQTVILLHFSFQSLVVHNTTN